MIKLRYGSLLFLLLLVHYCVYASEATITCVTSDTEIQQALPHFSPQEISTFLVDRNGSTEESNMTTKGLNGVVKNGITYKLTIDGFKIVEGSGELLTSTEMNGDPPPHVEIQGTWDRDKTREGEEANILGGNGVFYINEKGKELRVPLVTATEENLAYYNARLLRMGDCVRFSLSENFPITVMNVGQNYVDDYLMKKGGGFYMEHHNQPHFHMPMDEDANGFYLLGKKVEDNLYHFTAFRIPYGSAVYTNNDAIHCDAGLVGNYLVGYTIAREYSTVLLRSSEGERVKVVAV